MVGITHLTEKEKELARTATYFGSGEYWGRRRKNGEIDL